METTQQLLDKTCYIHTMEYHPSKKWGTYCGMLGNIMLVKEASTNGHILHDSIYSSICNKYIHRDRKKIRRCQGLMGGRNEDWLHQGDRVSFWDDRVLEPDRGDGCIAWWMYLMHWTVPLKSLKWSILCLKNLGKRKRVDTGNGSHWRQVRTEGSASQLRRESADPGV